MTTSPSNPARAAEPVEVLFSYTGAEQTFDVPAGVTSLNVVLVGGSGASNIDPEIFTPGGRGARVEGDLTVEPGTRLYVEVGGSAGPRFNGGGEGVLSGGGASDLRAISRSEAGSLDSRLVVAAGGGGAGLTYAGGDAGQPGAGGFSGGGATATAGGIGGVGDSPGQAGTLGSGGRSGVEDSFGSPDAGGGGGGYYGGGGGAVQSDAVGYHSGGGGGGSSYTGTATNASVIIDTTGVSLVSITYLGESGPTPPPDSGVVDAEVTVPTSAACIELSTTSVTFGTQRFGGENLEATPGITVTNCSGSDESLLARATDATGADATWQLVDDAGTCGAGTLAIDDYHLKLRRADTNEATQLASNNKAIRTLAAGAEGTLDALLDMPCPGSSGAGETMGMQIVFVVTE